MQRLRFILLAIPFVSFMFMSGAAMSQAATILAIDLAGNLHSIVTETGQLTPLGSTGIVQPLSLDRAPDGSLYTFTGGGAIGVYRVGENGQSSKLLISEPGLTGEGGLVFISKTKAYGMGRPGPTLFEIDLSTMSVMNIGQLVSGDDINGLALRDDGMLIGVDRVLNRVLAINPATTAVTLVSNLTEILVQAAGGFVVTKDGAFYANSSVDGSINELWKIDLYTGALSLVANFSGIAGISGLALPVPEPSAALLLGIGLLFLGRRPDEALLSWRKAPAGPRSVDATHRLEAPAEGTESRASTIVP